MAADFIDRLVQRYAAKKHKVSSLRDGGFTGNGLSGIFRKNARNFLTTVFPIFVRFPRRCGEGHFIEP